MLLVRQTLYPLMYGVPALHLHFAGMHRKIGGRGRQEGDIWLGFPNV